MSPHKRHPLGKVQLHHCWPDRPVVRRCHCHGPVGYRGDVDVVYVLLARAEARYAVSQSGSIRHSIANFPEKLSDSYECL